MHPIRYLLKHLKSLIETLHHQPRKRLKMKNKRQKLRIWRRTSRQKQYTFTCSHLVLGVILCPLLFTSSKEPSTKRNKMKNDSLVSLLKGLIGSF